MQSRESRPNPLRWTKHSATRLRRVQGDPDELRSWAALWLQGEAILPRQPAAGRQPMPVTRSAESRKYQKGELSADPLRMTLPVKQSEQARADRPLWSDSAGRHRQQLELR